MIKLTDITKVYRTRRGVHTVLDGVNLIVYPGDKIGIIGRNGAGKSTLIRLLSGAESPTSGQIYRGMSISWPLAFGGAFQGSLTGVDNIKFICRVYGVDYREKIMFVEDFAELGKYLHEPVKTYSSGMRARLAFAISMAIEFDCFLIDEIFSVGDARFQEKCRKELFENRKDHAFIIVSHEIPKIRRHCQRFCVLYNGELIEFDRIEKARRFHMTHF